MHPLQQRGRWRLSFQAIAAEPALYFACALALAAPGLSFYAIAPLSADELRTIAETGVQPRRFVILTLMSTVLTYFAYIVAAAFAHHYFLNRSGVEDGTRRQLSRPVFLKFLGWSAVFFAVTYSTIYIGQTISPPPAELLRLSNAEAGDPKDVLRALFVSQLIVLTGPLLGTILLCMTGTMFPAIIHGGDASFGAALRRKGAWRLFWGLLTGPMIVLVAFVALSGLMSAQYQNSKGLLDAEQIVAFQRSLPGIVLYLVLTPALNILVAVMTAATLSRHYLRRESAAMATA